MFQKLSVILTIAVGIAIWRCLADVTKKPQRGSRDGRARRRYRPQRRSPLLCGCERERSSSPLHDRYRRERYGVDGRKTQIDLGLRVDPSRYEVIGDGASGMVRGQYVQLQRLDLNGIHQDHTKAVVVQGATVSLLGQPFLRERRRDHHP